MCGPHSALGLEETERVTWPVLRERLRQPGRMMALMRGVLGGDTEITLGPQRPSDGVRRGHIGDDEVDVVVDDGEQPLAVIVNSWIFHNLTLYTRKLWSPPAIGRDP